MTYSMKYFWIEYEGIARKPLIDILNINNIFIEDGEIDTSRGRILATSDMEVEKLTELFHAANNGQYASVVEADYDKIEHLL